MDEPPQQDQPIPDETNAVDFNGESEPLSKAEVISGLSCMARTMDGSRFAQSILALHNGEFTTIDVLENYPHVRSIDLSGNKIRDIKGIAFLKALMWANLSSNSISSVPSEIFDLQYLQHLNLSGNKLEKLTISGLPGLTYLNVSKNKLKKIEINGLGSLQSLEARDNELEEVKITAPQLRFLYLTENKLKSFDGISDLPEVERLYLRNNLFVSLESISNKFQKLKHLNIRRNSITTLDGLSMASALALLESLTVSENSVCDLENYRIELLSRVPQLQVIDGTALSPEERKDGEQLRTQRSRVRGKA